MKTELTQEKLKELIHYDPKTGVFTWLQNRSDKVKDGHPAGCKASSRGYKRICIDYQNYQAHRVAFLYMTGKWPTNMVDHIDGNPSNNKWSNLRQADARQNAQNKAMQRNNKSGHIGIWKPNGRNQWVVQVCGKHIASCPTMEEAKAAYHKAATDQFGEFYRQKEAV
jgi:hypothetical protein